MKAYATSAEYETFTGKAPPDDFDYLVARASRILDSKVLGKFAVDDTDELPTDTDVAAAMRDACCAQVEFLVAAGVDHDVEGLAGTDVNVTGYSGRRPGELSRDARRILKTAGLM